QHCEKECCYTVCRPVYEQHVSVACHQIQKQVCEQHVKECCQTVCRPVCETHYKTQCCQVCKCVQEQHVRTVQCCVCKEVCETTYRECCEVVCKQVQTMKTCVQKCGEWVTETYTKPGRCYTCWKTCCDCCFDPCTCRTCCCQRREKVCCQEPAQ